MLIFFDKTRVFVLVIRQTIVVSRIFSWKGCGKYMVKSW